MSRGAAPILVTGAHRTGTTWVGRMLAAGDGLAYVSEPLNVHHRPGVFRAPVRHWYTYICTDNASAYRPAYRDLLGLRYHLGSELLSLRSFHDALRMGRDLYIFTRGRISGETLLIKDPFAVLSLRWFAEELKCQIVVTVRHPAAFARGLKRLGWSFDFDSLLSQPLLMRDHLGEYREAMRGMPADDMMGQAGLLWAMIYGTLHALQRTVPGILLVKHEQLALDPIGGFRDLYRQLGLEFDARVERKIRKSSSSDNPVELSRRTTHSVKMDSRASLQNWRKRLSEAEVERVQALTADVASLYYPEESWN